MKIKVETILMKKIKINKIVICLLNLNIIEIVLKILKKKKLIKDFQKMN